MKVLLTGFDPFDGEKTNPSIEAVRLVKKLPEGMEVYKLEVPTVFGKAFTCVKEKMMELYPDYIICVGQAGGRDAITPERVAINVIDARIPDNEGNAPLDQKIEEQGPTAYFSTLPIKAIAGCLNNHNINSVISNTAGTFVCNYLMYEVLHYIASNNLNMKSGFVHVPFIPEQCIGANENKPSMELQTIAEGLEYMLNSLIEF